MTSFSKGIKWNTIATGTSSIIAIFKLSILAGYLTKSELGSLAIIMFVVSLADIGIEGGAASVVYFRQSIDKIFYSTLHWFVVGNGLLFALIILLISPFASFFFNNGLLSELLPFISIAILISSFGKISRSFLSKNLEFRKLALIDLTGSVISFTLLIALLIAGLGIYGVLYSLIASNVLISSLLIYSVQNYRIIQLNFSVKIIKESVSISSYSFISQAFNFLSKEVDIIIIGKFLSMEFLGIYSLAKQLFQKPSKIVTPIISKVSLPLISSKESDKNKVHLFQKITSIVFSLNFITVILSIIFGYPAIVLLYGFDWIHIYPIGCTLSLVAWIQSSRGTLGSLTTAFGRTDYELLFSISASIFSAFILYVGASVDRLSWFYVSLILSSFSTLLPLYFLVRKLTSMSSSEFIRMFRVNSVSIRHSIKSINSGV